MKRRDFIKYMSLITALPMIRCSKSKDNDIKIVLLGFDGANWLTIDPLIKKGKLPFLKELKENSAWATFKSYRPAKSNVIWTSIATGKHMLKHGIMDFTYLKDNGIKVPYRKSKLKEPTIWEIIDEFKKKSVVINWWVSHPPDRIKEVKISDEFRNILTKKLTHLNEYKDSVFLEEFFDFLKFISKKHRNLKKVLKRIGFNDYVNDFKSVCKGKNYKDIPVLKIYNTLIKQDSLIEETSYYLYKKFMNIDMYFTYFRFPDVVQHFLTCFMDPNILRKLKDYWQNNNILDLNNPVIIEAYHHVSDLLESIYMYMEKIIKNFMNTEKNKNTYFFIVSDHGFSFHPYGYNHYNLPENFKAPDGIFMLKGPGVIPGEQKSLGVMDVVPNILYLMNLPIGKRMDGKVINKMFNFSNKITYKNYIKKKSKLNYDKKLDKDAIKRLKSMGYI